MAPPPASVEPDSAGRLDERILAALQRFEGEIAFNGLRRVLGAHPESLARALRRLEREGLVAHVGGAYRALTYGGGSTGGTERLRTVAAVDLPDRIEPEELVGRLASRWFGSLRWVGFVERPDDRLLAWAPRDGATMVLLSAHGRRLRVLVPAGVGDGDLSATDDAAFELLFHAVEALREIGGRPNRLLSHRAIVGLRAGLLPGPRDN